ncbi:hypothetical protein ABZ754_13755 [Micromonospora purpureochromogenes]|uniref:hypothetical protein n=1 Tax=Micromonospora purpureochromogenes TaxID=47872 RepID=UPI0033FED360
MNIAESIKRKTYRVAGTDCDLWVGLYVNKSAGNPRHYCHLGITGTFLDVRKWLFGNPYDNGFNWTIPVCGNGRCLTPEHQGTSMIPEATASE